MIFYNKNSSNLKSFISKKIYVYIKHNGNFYGEFLIFNFDSKVLTFFIINES